MPLSFGAVAVSLLAASGAGEPTLAYWADVCEAQGEVSPPDFTACERKPYWRADPQGQQIWVRVIVGLPEVYLRPDRPLGVFVSAKAASEVFLNGVRLGSNGAPAGTPSLEQPGKMDAVFFAPRSSLRVGANEIAIRMSSFRGFIRFGYPIHFIGIDDYTHPTHSLLARTWRSLIPFGALVAGLLTFSAASIAGGWRRESVLLGLLCLSAAGLLFTELYRSLVPYLYPTHDWRMLLVTAWSFVFGLCLAAQVIWTFLTGSKPEARSGRSWVGRLCRTGPQGRKPEARSPHRGRSWVGRLCRTGPQGRKPEARSPHRGRSWVGRLCRTGPQGRKPEARSPHRGRSWVGRLCRTGPQGRKPEARSPHRGRSWVGRLRRTGPQGWTLLGVVAATTLAAMLLVEGYDIKAAMAVLLPATVSTALAGWARWQGRSHSTAYAVTLGLFVLSCLTWFETFMDTVFFFEVAALVLVLIFVQSTARERERAALAEEQARAKQLAAALEQHGTQRETEALRVPTAGRVDVIDPQDIMFCKGAGDYVELHLRDGRQVLHHCALARLEDELPASFLRVHRSYLVNTRFVRSLRREPSGVGALTLVDGDEVPVSRRIMPKVRSALA